MTDKSQSVRVSMGAMFDPKMGTPRIFLQFDGHQHMFTIDDTRSMALSLLEVTTHAEVQQFMYEFLTEKVGTRPEVATAMVSDYHDWVVTHRKLRPGETMPEQVNLDAFLQKVQEMFKEATE